MPLVLSHHAVARMRQRGIALSDVLRVVEHGAAQPDAAPAGADARMRHTGTVGGRYITVIVASGQVARTVITVF